MIEPIGSRVLVEPKKKEEKTQAGIYIPTNKDQIQQVGTVIAVGSGHMLENGKRAPLSVKEKDTVIFAQFAGVNIEDDGKQYLLLEERDILAKIKSKK